MKLKEETRIALRDGARLAPRMLFAMAAAGVIAGCLALFPSIFSSLLIFRKKLDEAVDAYFLVKTVVEILLCGVGLCGICRALSAPVGEWAAAWQRFRTPDQADVHPLTPATAIALTAVVYIAAVSLLKIRFLQAPAVQIATLLSGTRIKTNLEQLPLWAMTLGWLGELAIAVPAMVRGYAVGFRRRFTATDV